MIESSAFVFFDRWAVETRRDIMLLQGTTKFGADRRAGDAAGED